MKVQLCVFLDLCGIITAAVMNHQLSSKILKILPQKPTSTFLQSYATLLNVLEANEHRSVVLIFPSFVGGVSSGMFQGTAKNPLFMVTLKYEHSKVIKVTSTASREEFVNKKIYFLFLEEQDNLEANFYQLVKTIYFWCSKELLIITKRHLKVEEFNNFYKVVVAKYHNVNTYFLAENGTLIGYNFFKSETIYVNTSNYKAPDIIGNLNGRKVKIAMMPNLAALPDGHGGYKDRDGVTSKMILESMNGTPEYILPDDNQGLGNANDTHVSGILGLVHSMSCAASFNSRFYKTKYLDLVDLTYPHDRDDLVILIPIPKPKRQNLFTILPLQIYLLLLISLLIFCLYLKSANKQNSYSLIFLHAVLILTSRGVVEFKTKHYRLIFVIVLFVVFEINVYFSAHMVSVLTASGASEKIKTLKEFAESEIKLNSWDQFQDILDNALDDGIKTKIIKKTKFSELEFVENMLNNCTREAFAFTAKQAKAYRLSFLARQQHFCYYEVEQHTIPSLMAYLVNYGSPMTILFDKYIQRLVESGIHKFWEFRTDLYGSFYLSDNYEFKKINLGSLKYTFICYGVCMTISFLVFVVELLMDRNNK